MPTSVIGLCVCCCYGDEVLTVGSKQPVFAWESSEELEKMSVSTSVKVTSFCYWNWMALHHHAACWLVNFNCSQWGVTS